jgi:hypothetical protein
MDLFFCLSEWNKDPSLVEVRCPILELEFDGILERKRVEERRMSYGRGI